MRRSIVAVATCLVMALWPQTVSADGPAHHIRPDWVSRAEWYELVGWRYYAPSPGLLYGYGPIPIRGEKAHLVVWLNRQFQSQYPPSRGLAYVVDQVLQHAKSAYGDSRLTLFATKPLTRAQVFEYWRTGMVVRAVPSVFTRLATTAGKALAGPAGSGLAALPCGVWQQAGVLQCKEAVRE